MAQVGPSLYARTAVPAGRIHNSGENTLQVQRLRVVLRDTGAPTLSVRSTGPFGDGLWHRGSACSRLDAADGGLGVYSLGFDVDGRTVAALAPKGTTLQPRPRQFGADLCVDTRLLHDGYLTALFRASDGVAAGGNAAARGDARAPGRQHGAVAHRRGAPRHVRSPAGTDRARRRRAERPDGGVGDGRRHGRCAVRRPTAPGAAGPTAPLAYDAHVARFHATDAAGTYRHRRRLHRRRPRRAGARRLHRRCRRVRVRTRDADSGIGVAGLAVALDGRNVDAAGTFAGGIFRYLAPARLAAGMHAVQVRATDGVGNVTTRTWTFPWPPCRRHSCSSSRSVP